MLKFIDLSTGTKLTKRECKVASVNVVLAKQFRLPFKSIRQQAKRFLDILQADVCEPLDLVPWNRKTYIFTVLDGSNHNTGVYLLKYKHAVTEYLKEFIAQTAYHKFKSF